MATVPLETNGLLLTCGEFKTKINGIHGISRPNPQRLPSYADLCRGSATSYFAALPRQRSAPLGKLHGVGLEKRNDMWGVHEALTLPDVNGVVSYQLVRFGRLNTVFNSRVYRKN
jgi:hypothetical protein